MRTLKTTLKNEMFFYLKMFLKFFAEEHQPNIGKYMTYLAVQKLFFMKRFYFRNFQTQLYINRYIYVNATHKYHCKFIKIKDVQRLADNVHSDKIVKQQVIFHNSLIFIQK